MPVGQHVMNWGETVGKHRDEESENAASALHSTNFSKVLIKAELTARRRDASL